MSIYAVLLVHFLHIIAGVGWAGGAIVYFLFVEPTAKALAPAGMQFVEHMVTKRRYSIFMSLASTLTVLTGAVLLWPHATGNFAAWLKTGSGLGFTLGSALGIAVYFVGMFGVRPRAEKLAKIGQEIQLAGAGPTSVQGAQLMKLDKEMASLGLADFILVALSLTLMASARYLFF
jgi:uncharacterized membrane protein